VCRNRTNELSQAQLTHLNPLPFFKSYEHGSGNHYETMYFIDVNVSCGQV
jgi:hypothetical protein